MVNTLMRISIPILSIILWLFMLFILIATPVSIASIILSSLCFFTGILGIILVTKGGEYL
jgi:hypothetical protein